MSTTGIEALRNVLRRLRNDAQGGYDNVSGGRFLHATSLSMVSAAELDQLFALAGIKPDEIKINGDCKSCCWGDARGGDLGWANPCCGCSRPKMTNFVPLAGLTKQTLSLTAIQASFLINVQQGVWWATGIVTAKQFSAEWNRQLERCYRIQVAVEARGLMVDGALGGRRLTNKGLRALHTYLGKP